MFQIKDLACGYGFTVYACNNKDYKLFGCGLNTDCQIGRYYKQWIMSHHILFEKLISKLYSHYLYIYILIGSKM